MKSKAKHFKEKKKDFFPFFLIISLIIMCICAVYIYKWLNESNHNNEVMEIVKNAVIEENDNNSNTEKKINFTELKEYNSDIVGWLKVNNTEIDYPVVKYTDNSFYLKHSLDKTYNTHGWIFTDYQVNLDGNDKNITIYGHNIKDGSMFGSLKNILEKDWYKNSENLDVSFITEDEDAIYRVFSVYQIEKETYYTNNYFKNDSEYESFIQELKSRSIVNFNTDVNIDDQILTLSTCATNNNYRVVLHAKKIVNN